MTSIISDFSPPLKNNGELLIGKTNNLPVVSTLTAGSGINITNGPGSITVSGLTWNLTPTAGVTLVPFNGYSALGSATFVLPASPNLGDTYSVIGVRNPGGFTISVGGLAAIYYTGVPYTSNIRTTSVFASITLVCIAPATPSAVFGVLSVGSGTFIGT